LRYDLILVQEIRDSSGDAIKDLMELIRQADNRSDLTIRTLKEILNVNVSVS